MGRQIGIRLDDEIVSRLERAAEEDGVPLATLIARVVEGWVGTMPAPAPVDEGTPFHAVRGSLEGGWPLSARRGRQGRRRASRGLSGDVGTTWGVSGELTRAATPGPWGM